MIQYTRAVAKFVKSAQVTGVGIDGSQLGSLYEMVYGPNCSVNKSSRYPWILVVNCFHIYARRYGSKVVDERVDGVGLFVSDQNGVVQNSISFAPYPEFTHGRALLGHGIDCT